jgi:hypothetical protein
MGFVRSSMEQAAYTFENLPSWPEPWRDDDALEFFQHKLGTPNSHILVHGRSGFSVVAIVTVSAKADKVVDAISAGAKEAADQCTGTRPAIIALHLVDRISQPELRKILATQNGLHATMHAVLKGGTRQHVDSIAFTVPQTRVRTPGMTQLKGNGVLLYNPQPKFPCPEARAIFARD